MEAEDDIGTPARVSANCPAIEHEPGPFQASSQGIIETP